MTTDDLDRILLADEPLQPSSGFVLAVMSRVREEGDIPGPIPFPWTPVLTGAAVVGLSAAGGAWAAARTGLLASFTETTMRVLSRAGAPLADPRVLGTVTWGAEALAGTVLFWWLVARLVRARG